jgi:tetratricopeptide (TPR) repeat protein
MLRLPRRLATLGWPGSGPRRPVYALGAAVLVVLIALIPVAIAQSSRRPPPGLQSALAALNEGKYDEVAGLTAKLDQQDPFVATVNARALIARGKYQEAEAALRPIAGRAPTSDAALELGLLLKMLGRNDATAMLQRVASMQANDAADFARSARALRALGAFQDANAAYRDAAATAPNDAAINTAWGELFLEKYQRGEAMKSFQAVLSDNPKYAPALLGAALALADDNPPQAVALAKQVVAINPNHVGAHVFLASQAADAGDRDDARQGLGTALDINPSSLDALSLLAALDYVEDKQSTFDADVARVLAIAPRYGDVYRVAGELAARNYRFDEAVTLTRRALSLDSSNPRTLAALGVHLLRTGDEPGARDVLEAAFKIDGFDVVTFNLLQMMDTLDGFVTATDGDIVLRMHKDEAPVLQEYALALSKQALATIGKRYGFTPKGPILIEMFPKHDDFAVRNVGLPGMIGALGACFGRVVTLDSPRARPPGDFQWEATLWHELAHVITIQMSNQRVPRWLTEGVSVYEETVQRPEWGRGQDVGFASMLNADEAIKLRDLNAAFQDPKTISVAYFEASLLVEHIVAVFGDAGLQKLLRTYGQGLEGEAALKAALGVGFDDLQTGFDQFLDRRFGKMQEALKVPDGGMFKNMPLEALLPYAQQHQGSFPIQVMLGRRLYEDKQPEEAIRAYERAAALIPIATGAESPNAQIAEISLERKDTTRAMTALEALMAADFDNITIPRKLAALMRDAKITDPARIRPVYERIVALDPYDADAHGVLGRLALQGNDMDRAIREFRTVVALGPVDRAAAFTDLAESYFRAGRRAEARKQTLAALEIAPSYERAQDLLLKLVGDKP